MRGGLEAAAVLACLLGGQQVTAQQEVWVDPAGSLAPNGQPDRPFRSIANALVRAQAGAIIHLRSGTYQAPGQMFPLRPTRSVTFRGHGRPTFLLDDSEVAFDLSLAVQSRLIGLSFVAKSGRRSRAVAIRSNRPRNAQQVTVEQCRFRGLGRGIQSTTDVNGAWTIRSNIFDSIHDTAIEQRGLLSISRIEHNTIYNTGGTGLYLESGNIRVRFNILQGNDVGIEGGTTGAGGSGISDNALWQNRIPFLRVSRGTGNTVIDPKLANPANGDFSLIGSSPVIDRVIPDPVASADVRSAPRLANGFDLGATRADYGAIERNPLQFAGDWPGGTRIELNLLGTPGRAAAVLLATSEGAQRFGSSDLLLDPNRIVAVVGGTLPLRIAGNTPSYPGARLLSQGAALNRTGSDLLLSRRVEVAAEGDYRLVTEFSSANLGQLDRSASSGNWRFGPLGGDGMHGAFDVSLARPVSTGVWELDTDRIVIPRTQTLSGRDEVVTDGVLRFSSFRLELGQELRFVGSRAPVILVRGEVVVDGMITLNGQNTGTATNSSTGQPGGLGGPFGGRGGNGGDRCLGTGPQPSFDGQDGGDVRLLAGHAYGARAVGTGGRGSKLFPTTGNNASVTFVGFFCEQGTAGGAGGGNVGAGMPGTITSTGTTVVSGPAAAGKAISLFPVPANADPIDHFLIGGSGGGGAGSQPLRSIAPIASWKSGSGGGGGGGAFAMSVGRSMAIASSGSISARGGSTSPNQGAVGIGGAGSGGSIYLAVDGPLQQRGLLDVSGGTGALLNDVASKAQVRGGDGADGLIRVETPLPTNLGRVFPPAGTNRTGTLTRQDQRTGLRSKWMRSGQRPNADWIRYEFQARINNAEVRFSDDPARGVLATTGQAIELRLQGARIDPTTGEIDPDTRTQWVDRVQLLNSANIDAIRIDLVQDRTVGTVQALRPLHIALDAD